MKKDILDSLLNTPQLFGSKVSPDVKWVVWSWANAGPHADIYIAPLDRIEAPRKLTDFSQNTFISSWTEDCRSIIVSHDYDGDERYCLYRIDILTGKSTRLTEEHPQYFIRGGDMTPDGKFLIYAANYDFVGKKEIETSITYRHDLATGEMKRLAEPKKSAFSTPTINPQGTHVLYRRRDQYPQGHQAWLVDIEGREDIEILNFGDKADISASWQENGEDITFTCESGTYRKVGVFNIISRSVRWLVDDPSRNIEDAWMPLGQDKLAIGIIEKAQNFTTLLDLSSGTENEFSKLKTALPLARLESGAWVSYFYNSRQPSEIIIHEDSRIIRSVTDIFSRVDYSSSDLAKAENHFWNSVDGTRIQGWVYRPSGKPIGTVVMVHGGPTAHDEDAWNMDIQYFASQGFAVLTPNYRGSTGFGLAFEESIKEDGWGGKEQDDIIEGIKYLIKEGISEEGKVGITGVSYGGYSAWCAITHYPKKYVAAAIPVCGMTDLVVDYETTRPDLRGYSEEMMGGTPTEVPEKYRKGSPINFIQNIEGELLIVQGAKDPNVSPENVRSVEEALKKHGIPYEKLIFEDEGHGISKPANQKTLLMKSVEFFRKSFVL